MQIPLRRPEKKEWAFALSGTIMTAVLGSLKTWVPAFHAPPAFLVAAYVTILGTLISRLTAHTHLRPEPPADPPAGDVQIGP